MEILGTKLFSESINISPVTKTRLSASVPLLYNGGEEMRSNLQSGDIVIRETSDGSVSQPSVYIKIEDWKKYGYAKALGMHSVTNTARGGVFVTYDGDKCKFGWTSVWNYNKYLESKTKFLDFKVTEIYRPWDFKQPAYIEYLKNPMNYNASLVWRRGRLVDESINVTPVTKTRLKNELMDVREFSLQKKLDNAEVKTIPEFNDGNYKYDREITLKLSENDLETLNDLISGETDESDYLARQMLSKYTPLPFGTVKLNFTMQYVLLNIARRNKDTKFDIDTSHPHVLKIEKQ